MHNALPFTLAALVVAGVTIIGTTYLISPQSVSNSFGLKPPASDPATLAWLRLKGIRDLASGLVVLTLMLTADKHSLAVALLAFAIIPFGDMSIILASGGSKVRAFSIHGLTCAVMLIASFLLLHAL